MKILEVNSTVFPDVKIIRYGRFPDERGFFAESFRKSDIKNQPELKAFNESDILQINISYSKMNVVRGLHFQWKPDMGKMIRVIDGAMIDVFLDIRRNSTTFGKIGAIKMEADPTKTDDLMIWIPAGFAHGVAFLKTSYIEYYCTAEYSPTTEAGIFPLASDIDWSLCDPQLKKEFNDIANNGLISDKDRKGLTLNQWKADPRSENF